MNYNKLLDMLFSVWYIYFGICLAIIIIFLLLTRKWDSYIGKSYIGTAIAALLFFIYVLINPLLLGYGRPQGVSMILSKDDKLYVVDYMTSSNGKGFRPSHPNRIQILNSKTGDKLMRFHAGSEGELCGITGDSLIFYHYRDIEIFSASTGKSLAIWDNKTLPKVFSELSSGIDNTMMEDGYINYEITSLDGNKWILNLSTAKLSAFKGYEQNPKYIPTNKLYLEKGKAIRIDNKRGGSLLLKLENKSYNNEIKYLTNNKDTILNKDLKFIRATIIALDTIQNCFVVLSYTTTKKTCFILTGISMDAKSKLWELKQSTIRPTDKMEEPISISSDFNSKQEKLYFAMKDEIMALQISDGKVLWMQNL